MHIDFKAKDLRIMDLKDYLSKNGISQVDFSNKIGITQARISQIVNKKANPSIVLAKHIEEVTKGKVTVMNLISQDAPSRFKVKRNEKE